MTNPKAPDIHAPTVERCAEWHDEQVKVLARHAADGSPNEARAIAYGAVINVHRESAAAIQ